MKQSEKSYYSSTEDITVERFYRILQTKDYRYMVKGWQKGDDLELSEEEIIDLSKSFSDIKDGYTDSLSGGKGLSDLFILGQIGDLEVEVMVVGSLISILHKHSSEAIKSELREWKYPDDVEGAFKKLKSTKFRLKMMKSKNKHLLESDQDDSEVQYDLYKDVVMLEQALGYQNIDPTTMVLAKWVEYIKVAEEKNKKKGNGG